MSLIKVYWYQHLPQLMMCRNPTSFQIDLPPKKQKTSIINITSEMKRIFRKECKINNCSGYMLETYILCI